MCSFDILYTEELRFGVPLGLEVSDLLALVPIGI
jgi:hypothetical protein